MASADGWLSKCSNIDGILCDIHGVLYDSGTNGNLAIPGSTEAIEKLKAANVPIRFCTNETQCTKEKIAAKLNALGYSIRPDEIFSPAPAACGLLKERGLRPHLLVHPDVLPEFSLIDQSEPNCVVMGDAAEEFSYENMNKAFQLLISLKDPVLISMGRGKYYKQTDGMVLDVGCFMKALEYASDTQAEIIGKPAPAFFQQALNDMGVAPDRAVMVGDDIVNDVGGAQACGLLGVQVRTGKYRSCDEPHETVKPDGYVNDFEQFVELLLEKRC